MAWRIGRLAACVVSVAVLLVLGGCVDIDVDASGHNIPGLSKAGDRSWSYQTSPFGTQKRTTSDGVSVETYTWP
jgi:hypothetical protein